MLQFRLTKAYTLAKCCGHGAKSYTIWKGLFTAGMCLVVQSKKESTKMAIMFQLHIPGILKSMDVHREKIICTVRVINECCVYCFSLR